MARAKDAPASRGGDIDPYVMSSIQRGKEQAGNRLVESMREAGAAARTRTQEAGAAARTRTQEAGAMARTREQLAAELALQDKRSAEAEIARREDHKYKEMTRKAEQMFEAEESRILREHQRALLERNIERADELLERWEDARMVDHMIEDKHFGQNVNAALSVLKGLKKQETVKQNKITLMTQEKERAKEAEQMRSDLVDSAAEGFRTDRRMDFPSPEEAEEKLSKLKISKSFVESPITTVFRLPSTIEKTLLLEEQKRRGIQVFPVLQDQLLNAKVSISVEDLHPSRVHNIEEAIADNRLQAEDIRNTLAVLEGGMKAVDEKIKESESDATKKYLKEKKHEMLQMRATLEGRKGSTRKVKGRETDTVGSVIKHAMGLGSFGKYVQRLEATEGENNWDAIAEKIVEPLDHPSYLTPSRSMSPNLKRGIDKYNALQDAMFGGSAEEEGSLYEIEMGAYD